QEQQEWGLNGRRVILWTMITRVITSASMKWEKADIAGEDQDPAAPSPGLSPRTKAWLKSRN
ncbi:MAG: hypothetical protein ABR915_18300, partial [Thermoguttaceae bacterium]